MSAALAYGIVRIAGGPHTDTGVLTVACCALSSCKSSCSGRLFVALLDPGTSSYRVFSLAPIAPEHLRAQSCRQTMGREQLQRAACAVRMPITREAAAVPSARKR